MLIRHTRIVVALAIALILASVVTAARIQPRGITMWTGRNAQPGHLWMWVTADPAVKPDADDVWDLPPAGVYFFDAPDKTTICAPPDVCTTLGEFRTWLKNK